MSVFSVTTWNVQEKLGWQDQQPGIFEELRRAAGDKLGVIALCDAFREIDTRSQRGIRAGDVLGRVYDFAQRLGFETYHTTYEDTVPYPPERRLHNLQQNLFVLSNMPTDSRGVVRLGNRMGLDMTVLHENETIDATAMHSDSRSTGLREVATKEYLALPRSAAARLVFGDLNRMHYDDRRARLLRNPVVQALLRSPLMPHYGGRFADMAHDDTLCLLEKAGFRDADPSRTPTMYGPGGLAYVQLDHIEYSEALVVTKFTPGRRGPSDHRWVQAQLAWAA